MEEKKLPPRLNTIAAWVRDGAALADVGTDHALLPLDLLKRGKIRSAIATDINEEPLRRARANAAAWEEERIRFCLCDGLADVAAGEADCVVIAGLGGENIADILRRALWVRDGVQLLLQPMSRAEVLHRELIEMGFSVHRERLVEDAGRVYPILEAFGGSAEGWSDAEYFTGPYELLSADPLFPRYLEEQYRRLSQAVKGMEKSGREADRQRAKSLRGALIGMEEMRGKLNGNGI